VEVHAPHLGDPAGVDPVEGELLDGDRTARRFDAEERRAMRSGVRQVRGDPRCVDDEVAQLPPVVGEGADDGSLPLDVGVDAALDAVDRDAACDELAQVAVRMLVAARVVAAVERGKLVSVMRSMFPTP
jgi:hypothetical protein